MRSTLCLLFFVLALPACGDRGDDQPGLSPWQHTKLVGLRDASGVTLHGNDLVLVAGGGDREVYTVVRADLRAGRTTPTRTLAVTINPKAPTMGSEALAHEGYQMSHLWNVPVDFQGVAAQEPNFLYVGERHRRLVFWGRMRRDADGRLASVHLDHVAVAPGANRSAVSKGDWRDHGSGLRGLTAPRGPARQEDLWLVERGTAESPVILRRMGRYGTNLKGIRARHAFESGPDCRAVSWDADRLVVLLGSGRGRFVTLKPPASGELTSVPEIRGVPGPEVDGVTGWTGMAHGSDGTIFLVSGGNPAVLAWRKP
jgi:hypothetical protein